MNDNHNNRTFLSSPLGGVEGASLQAATTVFLPITQVGRNYLPDVQKLSGRLVRALHVPTGVLPLHGGQGLATPADGADLSLGLTEDGTSYFLRDASLALFMPAVNRGIDIPLGRTLSVMDCYLNAASPALVGRTVALVFWYDAPAYAEPRDGLPMYDNFDTPVHLDRPLANQYLPDVRTLAACSLEALYLELPATTPCYQEGVAADEASALYLSLVRGSYAVLDAVPLSLFRQSGNWRRYDLGGLRFDFENSFIQVAAGAKLTGLKHVNLTVKYK